MVSYHMARQEELSVSRQGVIYSILGGGGLLLYVNAFQLCAGEYLHVHVLLLKVNEKAH